MKPAAANCKEITCEEALGQRGVGHKGRSHVFAALQQTVGDCLLLENAALHLQQQRDFQFKATSSFSQANFGYEMLIRIDAIPGLSG